MSSTDYQPYAPNPAWGHGYAASNVSPTILTTNTAPGTVWVITSATATLVNITTGTTWFLAIGSSGIYYTFFGGIGTGNPQILSWQGRAVVQEGQAIVMQANNSSSVSLGGWWEPSLGIGNFNPF